MLRIVIFKVQKRDTDQKKRFLAKKGTVPVATIVAVRLSAKDLEHYPAKFASTFNDPCVTVECS